MTFLNRRWVVVAFRMALGVMLIYASFDKIANPSEFSGVIANYQLIPFYSSNLLAILLPWLEFFVGACLILGLLVDGAAFLTMGMMVVFIVALSQATVRGLDIECGCFKDASKVGVRRIVEDFVWLGMAYVIWRRVEKPLEIYPKSV
ncbi:MAG: MauE/DoxX family redox-associated membrane protein [Candidatus Neomarinimicrobiota bacterium]